MLLDFDGCFFIVFPCGGCRKASGNRGFAVAKKEASTRFNVDASFLYSLYVALSTAKRLRKTLF